MNFSGGGCREKSFEKGTAGADMVVEISVVVVDILTFNTLVEAVLGSWLVVPMIYMELTSVIRPPACPRFRQWILVGAEHRG